jgi:hypothetical protein
MNRDACFFDCHTDLLRDVIRLVKHPAMVTDIETYPLDPFRSWDLGFI